MRVPFVINRAAPVPLQRQIYDGWRQAILSGRFRGGDRVPSTREHAAALGVSRVTVTAAYDQLVGEGYFEPVTGSGTFIARELPDYPAMQRAGRSAPAAAPLRLSAYARRLEGRSSRQPAAPGEIDLSGAGPDLDYFPFAEWRRLLLRQLRRLQERAARGREQPAGDDRLRREIAAYLGRSRGVQCGAEQVVVTNGSQQALDLCLRVLVDPGDPVAIEDPGYPGIRLLAAAHGASIQAVRVDDEGLRVTELSDAARVVHVTPSHQFPTGVSLSLRRRLELLEWAASRGAVVLEDDYDSEYRYSGPPLPALQGLKDGAPVVYAGTFSNVMFPGLRIGYVVVPRTLIAPFTRAKHLLDRYTPTLEQRALADFMSEGHLERHVRRMRRLYKRRREVLIAALDRHFGRNASVRGDAAGMHLLVRFAPRDMTRRAERRGVRLISADPYYMSDKSPNEFIISFSAAGERVLAEGIKRLA
jgi:GntR family transcriptional regulator/MocR family aminotransferase